MRKNCSTDQEKLLKFEAEGRGFAENLRSLEQFIQTLGYPISLLTPKTTLPCPSKDLRGPAPGHPEVYIVNPDLPRPPKRRGPASGSPGHDPDLDTLE